MQIPGMAVVKSEVYDSLGIAMPGKGDEVLEAPSRQEQGGLEALLQGMGKGDARKRDEVAVAARAQQATDGLSRALPAWLEPIKKKLIEARKSGATLADLRKQMLEWHPNTQALADAFADNVEAGLRGESAAETLTAQCNQHEHDEGCDRGKRASVRSSFKKLNEVATISDLKEYGIDKVYVDKNILGKIISRMRVTSDNAIAKLNAIFQKPNVMSAVYQENGIKRINFYKAFNGRVRYAVVDLDGKHKGKITTYIPRATPTHLKQKGLSDIP